MRLNQCIKIFLFLLFSKLIFSSTVVLGATCITFVNQYKRVVTECENSFQEQQQQQQQQQQLLNAQQKQLELQRNYNQQLLDIEAQKLRILQQAVQDETIRNERRLQDDKMASCTSELAPRYPAQPSLVKIMCQMRLR